MSRHDWIGCAIQVVKGDRVSIYQGGATMLFALVGHEQLRFSLNGNQLETYCFLPAHRLRPPAWVKR